LFGRDENGFHTRTRPHVFGIGRLLLPYVVPRPRVPLASPAIGVFCARQGAWRAYTAAPVGAGQAQESSAASRINRRSTTRLLECSPIRSAEEFRARMTG
jgi:hypothetical protein